MEELVLHASLRDELTRPLARVRSELVATAKTAETVGKAGKSGSGGLINMEGASNRLRGQLGTLNKDLKSASQWLGQEIGQAAKRGAVGLGIIGAAATGFGLKAASSFQQSQIAFETLLGSAEKGQALFKQLQAMNLKTPFQLSALTQSTQVLLRYGVAGDKVVPIVKSLSDIASTSDNPEENLSRLALAMGQIVSQGRVLGQDARQLAEAGFNPYAVLATKLGKSVDQVRKMGEAGKLSAADLVDSLINESDGLERFASGAEKANQTVFGQWSNFMDSLKLSLADAAKPLVDQLTTGMPALISLVSTFVAGVGPQLFSLVALLLNGLTRTLPIVQPILVAIVTGLQTLFQAAGPAMTALQPLGGEIGLALTQLVMALVPVMPDLVHLFVALVAVLPDFVRLLADLVPIVSPIARLATTLLGFEPVRQTLAALLTVLLGYRALASIATGLNSFAGGLRNIGTAGAGATGSPAAGGGANLAGIGLIGAGAVGTAAGAPGAVGGQNAAGDLGFIASGTALGAGLGSVIPGLGTGIGAVGGAAVTSGIVGARRLYESFFGDVAGNAARTAAKTNTAMAMAGGGRMTSLVRGVGTYPGSGHRDGTASDVAPRSAPAYMQAVKRLGGYPVHEGGHVHAQWGDSSIPAFAGADGSWGAQYHVTFPGAVFAANIDVERAVADGIARVERDRRERAYSERRPA